MHVISRLLHQSEPAPLRVIRAGNWEAAEGKDYPYHQHRSWELTYVRTGQIECPVGDEVFHGRPGFLLVIPPGVGHCTIARTAYQNFWIQFDGSDLDWPRFCMDTSDHTIGQLCTAMVREYETQNAGYTEMNALLLAQLYIVITRMREEPEMFAAEKLIRHVEVIVAERYRTPLKVGEIAHEVGVSDSYLRSQFVRLRGCTPSEHMQKVRVKHAIALLQASTLTLEAIADACGYNSASHLTRHIKRATGKTPGALRD